MTRKSTNVRHPRTVPIDRYILTDFFNHSANPPDRSLRRAMDRGRIDRNVFGDIMRRNRVPTRLWAKLLPEGGVEGISPGEDEERDQEKDLQWFPNENNVGTMPYAPLSSVGAGVNDWVESVPVPNPRGGVPLGAIPLNRFGPEPSLRLHFRHRVSDLNLEQSYWFAVVGFAPGAHVPEWQTVDITDYHSVQLYVRAYVRPDAIGEMLPNPLPLLMRFEDDKLAPGRNLHRSSSWCRSVIEATQWSRPEEINLQNGFRWGDNAFYRNCPAVDRRRIVQITLGLDATIPDCEGYIEIQQIILRNSRPSHA